MLEIESAFRGKQFWQSRIEIWMPVNGNSISDIEFRLSKNEKSIPRKGDSIHSRKMRSMKSLGATLFLLFVATAVFAQSAEFGRAGGDEIALPFKKSGNLSGSFDFSTSSGGLAGKSFGGTVGGALIADRLWFFTTMQRDDTRGYVPDLALPKPPATATSRSSQPAFFKHW